MIWIAGAIVLASLFIMGGLGAVATGLKDLAAAVAPYRHRQDAAFLERMGMNAPPRAPLCPHGREWDDCPDCRH